MAEPIATPWTPTPEQEAKLQAKDATLQWMANMPREVLQRYAGQWIAAKDCQVVASGKSMCELLTNLGDIDLETVIIHWNERPMKVVYR